jgi:predicted ribosome quality control (RQC) complex YloA/Tae2 family protein
MPFDGFTIKALTQELSTLGNARIDKIHQPERDELVLSIRNFNSGHVKLVISANPRWSRLHLTSARKTNPSSPPSFCMMLRKVLEGGKIRSFKQIQFERIVHIAVEALDDFGDWKEKILVCEFMGKHSNIILVNPENNLIIDAIKKYGHDVSSYREVLPGKPYVAPPGQDKLDPLAITFADFCNKMWQQTGTVSDAIYKVLMGISPFSARQICIKSGINADLPVDQCGDYELSAVINCVNRLMQTCADNTEAGITFDNNRPVEYAPYTIENTSDFRTFSSINETCDHFFTLRLNQARIESQKTNLSRQVRIILDKAYKKLMLQQGDFNSAQDKEQFREWGELITTYAHQITKGETQALLMNYYTDEQVVIPLEARYTPIENAQRYFKTYNKSKRAIKHLEQLIKNNRAEIDYLESVMELIRQAETVSDIDDIVSELENSGFLKKRAGRSVKSEPKTQPRHFLSSDGLDILVGRNNHQNDRLTLKQSDRHDLWLHAKNIPGTHVIVRLPIVFKNIEDVPDKTLEEAASLAACFSKASDAPKVPVDYTFRANVRKPAGSKPGMVIYDNYWTIMVNPQSEAVRQFLEANKVGQDIKC